jgi:hypothetical protein
MLQSDTSIDARSPVLESAATIGVRTCSYITKETFKNVSKTIRATVVVETSTRWRHKRNEMNVNATISTHDFLTFTSIVYHSCTEFFPVLFQHTLSSHLGRMEPKTHSWPMSLGTTYIKLFWSLNLYRKARSCLYIRLNCHNIAKSLSLWVDKCSNLTCALLFFSSRQAGAIQEMRVPLFVQYLQP